MKDRQNNRRPLRCAIYTRKSSEEGLEQDFNSLHAQREACAAYIASQKHEGWQALNTVYDDGGISGGTMERPALKSLLNDVNSGSIDVVVVYKVDRLTRSLTDFAKIVEQFDAKGVSFVSVTQAFNTTSSMGRLTLNVLLSFAQFEREVTGERIRDKIAASKKKGLWMGGYVPMGYSADGRTLKVQETDAPVIRQIFDRFIALRSIRSVKEELDQQGVVTRTYRSKSERVSGGGKFTLGHLRKILTNRIYVGEIVHKGNASVGQHPSLIPVEVFDAAAAILSENKQDRRVRKNAKDANLLATLLFNANGNRLIGSHANKKGRRYRYYIEKANLVSGDKRCLRIPAQEIERLVLERLIAHLRNAVWVSENLVAATLAPETVKSSIEQAMRCADDLQSLDAVRQRESVLQIVDKIVVHPDRIEITVKKNGLAENDCVEGEAVTLLIEATLQSCGRHLALVLPKTDPHSLPRLDKPLLKAIARGVTWYEDLKSGRVASMRDLAVQQNVSERYVSKIIRYAFLAPDFVEKALEGDPNLPFAGADISANTDIPTCWIQQRLMR
jgi:site-specific DNA recombinase